MSTALDTAPADDAAFDGTAFDGTAARALRPRSACVEVGCWPTRRRCSRTSPAA